MGTSSSRSSKKDADAAELRRLEYGLPTEVLTRCRDTFAVLQSGGVGALRQQFRLDGLNIVTEQVIKIAFPPSLESQSTTPTGAPLTWIEFLRCVVQWRGLSERSWATKLCEMDANDGGTSRQSLRALALALSREASGATQLVLAAEEVKAFDGATDPTALSKPNYAAAALSDPGTRVVGGEDFAAWVSSSLPGLGLCLRDHLLWCAYGRPEMAADEGSEQRQGILTAGLAWSLAMLIGPAGPELRRWQRASLLYQQASHGSSTNIFLTKVEGYPGPVALLFELRMPDGESSSGERRIVVGAVVDASLFTPLGLSAKGAASACLLALHPRMCRFAVKVDAKEAEGRKQEVAYFTGHSRRAAATRATSSKAATGMLGFGGTSTTPRMELDAACATMTLRRAVKGDMFHSGPLVCLPEFDSYAPIQCRVLDWEVWGLGGEAAVALQQEARAREERFVEQRKHVDRAQFAEDWENSPDRAILGFATGGVTGREVARFSKAEEATLDRNRVERT